ncbi:hypothetical protein CYY_008666 [Polysphondylium violaceum]|uniref:sphinganine-1-phosphate aldolase n=1 Tax=Polysphondylium violaceum TaxID=133409 RepID=A0A8J4PQ21_9MYCE|nr:hypothetical protein CYY_008666 [Polysphondylium violaceum]
MIGVGNIKGVDLKTLNAFKGAPIHKGTIYILSGIFIYQLFLKNIITVSFNLPKINKSFLFQIIKKYIPSRYQQIQQEIDKQVDEIIKENFPDQPGIPSFNEIPLQGQSSDDILKILQDLSNNDIDPHQGKLFAYCYPTKKEHEELVIKANNMFIQLNALNPMAFQSLRKMECEVIRMSISMLKGDENTCGTMTTGGTESILLAIKSYRDRAKYLYNITEPEVVLPITAHPAFHKAGKYFSVKMVYVKVLDQYNCQLDLKDYKSKINRNTILLVGSAPQYPHGLLDPIQDIARLADKYKLPLHVDACIGGFFLSWMEMAGYPLPGLFDFRIPQVTSISADIHKYGYATKGSSVLLFKDQSIRKYQFLAYTEWPGGLFVSPSILGTRSGGNIAAAWASLVYLGQDGFKDYVGKIMKTSQAIQKAIRENHYVRIIGNPVMSIISLNSEIINVHALADVMESKFGWKLERQDRPKSIHMTLTPAHINIESVFIQNLDSSIEHLLDNPDLNNKGSAAMYSGINNIPITDIADEFLLEFLSKTYK